MKKLLIVMILIQGIIQAQTPCPRWGYGKEGTLVYALNMKKNRVDIPAVYKKISITDFLKLPDDSTGDGTAYELTGGFVIIAKKQGPESCNCKSPTDRDFHIVLVPDQKYSDSVGMYVIVEVSPRVKKMMNWSDQDIFDLKNKRVDFFGWKFADLEHKNMSLKSNPERKTCWRGTINELHPVLKFVVHPDGS